MVMLEMLRGSDVEFRMVWPSETEQPLDITDWTVAPFEAHPDLDGNLTLSKGDASIGEINGVITWGSGFRSGSVMEFRVQLTETATGKLKSTPVLQVEVK